MLRILDKYIAREFLLPFLGSLAGFTVMLLSGTVFELIDYIFSNDMPVGVVLELLVHSLPRIVVMILPIAALFGTLLALTRLSRDGEMGAIRSAGISFRRLAVPIAVAGLAVSALTFTLNEHIVPESEHRAQNLLREHLFHGMLPTVAEDVFFRGPEERFYYVGRVDTEKRQLRNIMIYETESGDYPGIITAEKGTYDEETWYLENGVSRTFDAQGHVVGEQRWESFELPVDGAETPLFQTQKTPGEMTRKELKGHIDVLRRSGQDIKSLLVEYHMKLSMPLASLIWMFVGAPLALRPVRTTRLVGIAVAILVAFAYFVVSAFFRSLGQNGALAPWLAAWMANILFFALGLWLTLRADRV